MTSSICDRITVTGGALFLNGSVLEGQCLASDQTTHDTSIDLNNYYGNRTGN